MSRVVQTLVVLAALGLVAGAATVFGGLYNVSARAGHLPGVSWVLHTTYRNAVKLRAPPVASVPDLSDPALVTLGALHFDSACRTCHAAPGEARTATARALVPEPPHVTDAVADWQPRHLHWIVHEGVKMSGMPGWPAAREDDVWAVVAFLDRVDETSAGAYSGLTALPVAEQPLAYCAACHGEDGNGPLGPYVPRIDILSEAYISSSLAAYRDGIRASGIMQHAASRLSPETLARLARHYGELTVQVPAAGVSIDPELIAAGEALALAWTGSDDVPACSACHGPGATRAADGIPGIAGQHLGYLETQLRLWRAGERGGGARANLMHAVARDLTDRDIASLSAFYASLRPSK